MISRLERRLSAGKAALPPDLIDEPVVAYDRNDPDCVRSGIACLEKILADIDAGRSPSRGRGLWVQRLAEDRKRLAELEAGPQDQSGSQC